MQDLPMRDLTKLPRTKVHDLMLDADRRRGRIAYAGLSELEDKLERQGIKYWHKRYAQRTEAHMKKNRQSPEYIEADALFRACSDRLREIDGDSLMRDRRGRKVSLF